MGIKISELPETSELTTGNVIPVVQDNETQKIQINNIIKNTESESTTQSYSCNYINNMNTYSTTEKKIGTWIDGKPLYRKVIDFGALPNASEKSVAHNISNIDKFVKIEGVCRGPSFSFTLPHITDTYFISINVTKTEITIITDVDRSAWNGIVFLEYTKTTD